MKRWERALALAGAVSVLAAAPAMAGTSPEAKTPAGALSGVREGAADAFLGIPYAAPPTGANRWRAPQPAAGWTGVRAADRFGASCWQALAPKGKGFGPWTHEYVVDGPVSEDCLFLNVWRPAKTTPKASAKLPVLVWIHGGGFSQGSGSVPIYDGANLAARGVVVVTINYRLGVLGFFAHPELTKEAEGGAPANWGLQDMVAALKWVQANIAAFGGDPSQVTIAGQSAGSMAVHELVVSPMAKGLFARAIAESGLPGLAPSPPLAQAEQAGLTLAKAKGAADLAALRALSPEQLAQGAPPLGAFPIVDGVLIPDAPGRLNLEGRFNDTPMLIGLNADEGSAMSQGYGAAGAEALKAKIDKAYGPMAARFETLYPASTDAERSAASKAVQRDQGLAGLYAWARDHLRHARGPVYAYFYTHPEPGPEAARYGAFHSSEIPYVLGTLDKSPERPLTAEDRRISLQLSSYWLNFIRTGDPNRAPLPAWPRLTASRPEIAELGAHSHARPILPKDKLEAEEQFLAQGGQPGMF
jgi:para-nitrobenzyl esterase